MWSFREGGTIILKVAMREREALREGTSPSDNALGTRVGATAGAALAMGEELVLVRSGSWRVLVPMRHVERIYGAVLPAVVPAVPPSHPLVSIGGSMVPLVFCEVLLGADSVTLDASDEMVLLRHHGRRALLWVGAAEEVVPYEPLQGEADLPALALGFSGRERAYAVLDVPKLLDLAGAPVAGDSGMGVPA